MPRQARIGLAAQLYHVTNRGNNRGWIFQEEEDFRRYIEIIVRYKSKGPFSLYQILANRELLLGGHPVKLKEI